MPAGRIVAIDPGHPAQGLLLDAARILRQGGIVAYPTETFYGLGVDPFNSRAVERLYAAKGRAAGSALILLVDSAQGVFDLATVGGSARTWFDRLGGAFWPGPLTLVLASRPRLKCPALAGQKTVAVRVSSHPVALNLTRAFGGPVTSTSANLSGDPPASMTGSISGRLKAQVDFTLDAGATSGTAPSTMLDLTGMRPRLLRPGSLPVEAIERVLGFRLEPNLQAFQ